MKIFPNNRQISSTMTFHLKYFTKLNSALSLNCNLSSNDGLAELWELIYTLKQWESETLRNMFNNSLDSAFSLKFVIWWLNAFRFSHPLHALPLWWCGLFPHCAWRIEKRDSCFCTSDRRTNEIHQHLQR